jgi:hypothetical protein
MLAGRLRAMLINNRILSTFQARSVINKKTVDKFVIKTTINKYLNVKRGHIYWCMVNLDEALDLIHREALWFKIRKKGVSENMVKFKKCTKV